MQAILYALLPALAMAQEVIYQTSTAKATVYYDLANTDECLASNGGPFSPGWQNGINGGYTACQDSGTTAYTLNSLSSNRIVAMDLSMYGKGPEYWCGKEVQIFDASGKQIVLDEGPFVVYDNCGACSADGIIDVSAKAFVAIKGGTCGGDNPTGLTVKILDRDVSPSGTPGGVSTPEATSAKERSSKASTTTKSTSKVATSTAATTSKASTTSKATRTSTGPSRLSTADPTTTSSTSTRSSTSATSSSSSSSSPSASASASPTASASASPSTGSIGGTWIATPDEEDECPDPEDEEPCEFGEYLCDGRTLRICNYVTWNELGWQEITTCANSCSFTDDDALVCV